MSSPLNSETPPPFTFALNDSAPVSIGGVGGSGTRLIAQCLMELGYYMGSDLNESNDNLLFTLLFKRTEILEASGEQFLDLLNIFLEGMSGKSGLNQRQRELVGSLATTGRHKLSEGWLKERASALLTAAQGNSTTVQGQKWGWKEPSTHVVVDRLLKLMPQMKYIHVARNGLDMAFSANQNQLAWWGKHFVGRKAEMSPQYSLTYWRAVHERILDIGKSMGANFLFLNYDKFCKDQEGGVAKLCDFLGVGEEQTALYPHLLNLIDVPESIGRHKEHDLSLFNQDDIRYVEQLGFEL